MVELQQSIKRAKELKKNIEEDRVRKQILEVKSKAL
jgi:hypothetical protein